MIKHTREKHAAHTGNGTGWDLERWDVTAPTLPSTPPAEGAEYHSGYLDRDGKQHWIFTRRAPLSAGTCPTCPKAPRIVTSDLIALAAVKAPSAAMRSSADICLDDAREAVKRGDDAAARMWAQRSLGYPIGVFQAREMAS